MDTTDEWFAGRYATVTLCVKRLLEEGDVPITHDILSIFWYSFTCFRSSSFEITMQRTMDMTMAYREFYRMTRSMPQHNIMFTDVVMFIIKGFPASATTNTCMTPTTPRESKILLEMSKQLIDDVIHRYTEYKENPEMITKEARKLYSHQRDGGTTKSDDTVVING